MERKIYNVNDEERENVVVDVVLSVYKIIQSAKSGKRVEKKRTHQIEGIRQTEIYQTLYLLSTGSQLLERNQRNYSRHESGKAAMPNIYPINYQKWKRLYLLKSLQIGSN